MGSNKKIGNGFEAEFCEILAKNGFWAHNMAQNQTGQPADVIAVRHNVSVLIDCKVCSNDYFDTRRIEPNQEAAMTLWQDRGNELCYFALKLSTGVIYVIHYNLIKECNGIITKANMTKYMTLPEWLEGMKAIDFMEDTECILRSTARFR